MTTLGASARPVAVPQRRRIKPRRLALYGFLSVMAITWLFPLVWALYTALRPYAETQRLGYISAPIVLSVDNFVDAWVAAISRPTSSTRS